MTMDSLTKMMIVIFTATALSACATPATNDQPAGNTATAEDGAGQKAEDGTKKKKKKRAARSSERNCEVAKSRIKRRC